MGEEGPGKRIDRQTTIDTLKRGTYYRSPLGTRTIAICLEEPENGSVAIGTAAEANDGNETNETKEVVALKDSLTRHPCKKGTVLIVDEGVLITLPEADGTPKAEDRYPESMKMLLARLRFTDGKSS